MPGTTTLLAVLGLVAAVAVLSACGSSDEFDGRISQRDAEALRTSLAQVRDDVSTGECDSASSGAQAFVDGVNALPETATPELKDALRTAGEQLERLVSEECTATGTTTTTTSQPSTTTSEPHTSTTSSTTTSTTTSTDTNTNTGTAPDEDGGPSGNGAGSGNGGATGGGGGADGGTGGSGGTRG